MEKSTKTSQVLQDTRMLLSSLIKKQGILEKCDENILAVLSDEADIEEEIENSTSFADRMIEATTTLELNIEHINRKMAEEAKPKILSDAKVEPVQVDVHPKSEVKLPKITISSYDGSLLKWNEFWSQFETTVHQNVDLTEIQKFTYLKSYLTAEAESAIRGLTLVKENYHTAIANITTRFGNKQARISAHMKELRTLKAVDSLEDVVGMQNMYDTLDLNINNLKELEVDVTTYSSLLIAIVFDCIPEDLRIKISLQFGVREWNLEETMKVFKEELEACERSLAISSSDNNKEHS